MRRLPLKKAKKTGIYNDSKKYERAFKMKKNISRVLFLLLTLALLIAGTVTTTFAAESESIDEQLRIYACNLSFENEVYILYAIKSTDPNVKLLVWEEVQNEYSYGTQDAKLSPLSEQKKINGEYYTIFKYTGVAARQMTDDIYVRTYIPGENGNDSYGAVHKYSILQYAYNKLGKTGTLSTNKTLIKMLNNMLAYGASAQEYHNYRTDRLATDAFVQIKVTGGLLSDGFNKGLYPVGTTATMTAPEKDANGTAFTGWQNASGSVISTDLTLTVTAGERNATYTACYGTSIIPTPEEYLTFTLLENDTYSISVNDQDKLPSDLVIPATYGGKAVTEIAGEAFSGCTALKTIVIPDSITNIGGAALSGCTSLESITVPFIGSVKDDTDYTRFGYLFSGSNSNSGIPSTLRTVEITGGTFIGSYAFSGCGNLTNITIPEGVANICNNAFSGCIGLTGVSLGNSLKNIGEGAFNGCKNITELTIPEGVTSIGNSAFYGCSSLVSIDLPDSVANIGNNAFSDCSGIREKENGVIYVGKWVVGFDNSAADVILRSDTLGIADKAFDDTDNLTSIVLPDGIQSIGNEAFYHCGGLSKITIPDSVRYIGNNAIPIYLSDTSLQAVYYSGTIGEWYSIYDVLHNTEIPYSILHCNSYSEPTDDSYFTFILLEDDTYSIAAKDITNLPSDLVIPSAYNGKPVTKITEGAFQNAVNLVSVLIPDSIISIGNLSFAGCSKIVSITIPFIGPSKDIDDMHLGYLFSSSSNSESYNYVPDSLREVVVTGGTRIGNSAFYGCSNLTNIILPDGIQSIGDKAFYNCDDLVIFELPDSVKSIGTYAFYWCTSLESVTVPYGVTSIGEHAFDECHRLASVIIPSSVQSIGDSAFSECSALESIEIPNSVTSIGDSAFFWSGLTSIKIPGSVKTIGYRAFDDTRLTSIIIENGVEIIGGMAFEGANITSLEIPDSVTLIDEEAFKNCSQLISINIGNGVTRVAHGAFLWSYGVIQIENGVSYVDKWVVDCDTSVTEVILRENTVGIADYAFSGCSNMTSIQISETVTSIGEGAFNGCSQLEIVNIPAGVTEIRNSVFSGCSSLANISIPEGVTYIGESAFHGCAFINIDIPDGVTYIGSGAFSNCQNLKIITIPEGVTDLYTYTFSHCDVLTGIVLGKGLTNIEDSVFAYCSIPPIYYTGTATQWSGIIYNALDTATHYFYSETDPYDTDLSGHIHWHYVEGVPALWPLHTTDPV